MKKFKQLDLGISIILIVVFTVLSFIRFDFTFIIGYFTVGGWQVISMLIHLAGKWFTEKNSLRVVYHWITLTCIILGLMTYIFPIFMWILYIMLFAAPLMAIFYTSLCYVEVKELSKRPLSVLK